MGEEVFGVKRKEATAEQRRQREFSAAQLQAIMEEAAMEEAEKEHADDETGGGKQQDQE